MNTPAKPSLPNDWPSAQRSGILSPERIAEIDAQVAARTKPLVTKEGKAMENAYVFAFPDGTNWIYWVNQYSLLDYHQRDLIAALLTPDELAAIKADSGRAYSARREAERFDKAIKTNDYEGVFWGDDYYSSLDEALDIIADDWDGESELPIYLWAAKPCAFLKPFSTSEILERYTEDVDLDCPFKGIPELQAALDTFHDANKDLIYYDIDYTRAVPIPPEAFDEIRVEVAEDSI